MPYKTFELDDLRRLIGECAGIESDVDLAGEGFDTAFGDLGYDSIALMEIAARITREYGVLVDESALVAAMTPRQLLDLVNAGG